VKASPFSNPFSNEKSSVSRTVASAASEASVAVDDISVLSVISTDDSLIDSSAVSVLRF